VTLETAVDRMRKETDSVKFYMCRRNRDTGVDRMIKFFKALSGVYCTCFLWREKEDLMRIQTFLFN